MINYVQRYLLVQEKAVLNLAKLKLGDSVYFLKKNLPHHLLNVIEPQGL